ncbi:hypothetical protein, partial [uncultured Xanthomarina sp.]
IAWYTPVIAWYTSVIAWYTPVIAWYTSVIAWYSQVIDHVPKVMGQNISVIKHHITSLSFCHRHFLYNKKINILVQPFQATQPKAQAGV